MEQIQVIDEKEMTAKLLKQFTIRTFIYSFLYFATIIGLFIFEMAIRSAFWTVLLIVAINVLFLILLSRFATTDAFSGINTTSAPGRSLKRITSATSVPMFVFTCVLSFMDIIFLHSIFDISLGYTSFIISVFLGIVLVNVFVWVLVSKVYEKRILKKYLTLQDEVE